MAKPLSDNAKAIFALVKEAHDNGVDITAKEIAEKTGLGPRTVNGNITMTFGDKRGTQEPVMIREEVDGVKYIRLVRPDFDPNYIPE